VIIAGFAPGLISMAILTVNNIRDIETDKVAGKKSLPVRFGRKFGIAEYFVCIALACLIPVYLAVESRFGWSMLLPSATLLFAIGPCRKLLSDPSAEQMNSLLAATGRLLLIYTILFSIGIIL
jgi:1,4-dihydroxy-2-naphthoate octaprenyltransferase